MGEPARERCRANSNRREILREHRTAREPRRDPATERLPVRQRRQRAAAAAQGAGLGAAAARRRDRDRRRTGRRPDRRDHRRRNRTAPCCPVLPRRRVRDRGRLPSRWPGRAGRPADRRQGHLRRLPARPRAPVSGGGRRRPGRLPSPPAERHSPIGHRLRGRVRRRRARRRHPGQRPRSRAAPARRGLRHVAVCRPHPVRGDHGNQARGRPAVHPAKHSRPGSPTTRRGKTPLSA